MEATKYIEISLKSAPQFCVNLTHLSGKISDSYSLKDVQGLITDKKYIRGKAETIKSKFDIMLAVDDIARITIVNIPVVEAPKKD